MRRIKIAFAGTNSAKWIAGIRYQKNLFSALRLLESKEQPEISLVAPLETTQKIFQDFNELTSDVIVWPNHYHRLMGRWTKLASMVRNRSGVWIGPQPSLGVTLKSKGIDCLFSSTHYGPRFTIPLLTWIPDFQHVHLPENFSVAEIRKRNVNFHRSLINADRIIVSSTDASSDLNTFNPDFSKKVRILSFVANVPDDIYQEEPSKIADIYYLPDRFFYLPNQFWRHKNHKIVIDAISQLRDERIELNIVCSGATHDYRDHSFFSELLAEISRRGLRENFIILGMIPYHHVLQLIRQSVAVIQPSLFEGWSTTVEESKSIGKRIILSDIAVHREQDPKNGVFFDPHSASSLAENMRSFHLNIQSGPDEDLESSARKNLHERQQIFAQSFINTVHELVE